MEEETYKVKILYYCTEKFYVKMRDVALKAAKKYPGELCFLMYAGFSTVLNRHYQEAIKELTPLQSNEDTVLGVLLALIHCHKRLSNIDKEILHTLDSRLKEERKKSTSTSLYFATMFLFMSERYDKALEYVQKILKKDSSFADCALLKGWIEIFSNNINASTIEIFESIQNKEPNNLHASLGLIKAKYLKREFDSAIYHLDKMIVLFPSIHIPLIEKMKMELAAQNWEVVSDTAERVLSMENDDLEVLRVKLIISICKKGDYIDGADQLDKYFSAMERYEGSNSFQFFITSQLFSYVCGRNSTLLSQVYRFAKMASEIVPNNAEYLTELGQQCLLQGKTKDAIHFFKSASKIDNNSISALCGLTLCQFIDNGHTEQVEQQVELLSEMQGNSKHPVLQLISARISRKFPERAVTLLDQASNSHMNKAKLLPYGDKYLHALNPDFLLEVINEYNFYITKKPLVVIDSVMRMEDTVSEVVDQCFLILNTIVKACPGSASAVYHLAKLEFLFGKISLAQQYAQHIVDVIDVTNPNGHLLMAQIHIQQNSYERAAQSLEICLSYNFKVRDNPMYHLLNGVIHKKLGKEKEALISFQSAMNILKMRQENPSTYKSTNIDSELNVVDKATLYLALVEIHTSLENHVEAEKVLQNSIQEFSYTSEEGRLKITSAEITLRNGDVDRAIELLSEIKADQQYYIQAHTKLAYIYLKEKNDQAMFTTCFRELVANHPGSNAHSLLGDAYMSIHEPEKAVEAYTSALKQNSGDMTVCKKFGTALVKTHQYYKAINFYLDIIQKFGDNNNYEVKLDLADLYLKLKQYTSAEDVITKELEKLKSKEEDYTVMKFRVKLLQLLANVRSSASSTSAVPSNGVLIALTEAKETQAKIVQRSEIYTSVDANQEQALLATCIKALAAAKTHRDLPTAASLYTEALVYAPRDTEILLALAKLYAQMNEPERCEQTCAILLNSTPDSEDASIMMADLAFRRIDFDTASRHLVQLLTSKPTCWQALAQLIDVQWRRGVLDEVESFVESAKVAIGDIDDPGYNFCAGLFARYSGRAAVALRLLNAARRSPIWSEQAATHMVQLCLAPEEDEGDTLSETVIDDGDYNESRSLALGTAQRLLDALPASQRRTQAVLLRLAARKRVEAEASLRELQAIESRAENSTDAEILLGFAIAYTQLKQPNKARKYATKACDAGEGNWNAQTSSTLERAWLLAADHSATAGRMAEAHNYLNRALVHNKSCAAAYHYLGYLAEKEQNYKSAITNYECAWKYGGKTNLTVGYKLAFCNLKQKKYPEAIIVCRHILKTNPDFPRIKKDILEKAKNHLRT